MSALYTSVGRIRSATIVLTAKILIGIGFLALFFSPTPRIFQALGVSDGSTAYADAPSCGIGGSCGIDDGGGVVGDQYVSQKGDSSVGGCSCGCGGVGCGCGAGCDPGSSGSCNCTPGGADGSGGQY